MLRAVHETGLEELRKREMFEEWTERAAGELDRATQAHPADSDEVRDAPTTL